MSGETINKNNPNTSTEWDSLANYNPEATEQKLQDDLANIEDMLEHGNITEEKAEAFRKEVTKRAEKEKQVPLDAESQKYLDDEFANIDDMLEHGRITAEKAETYREEVKQRAAKDTVERARREAEERARLEAEARARLEAEERARLEAEERNKATQANPDDNPEANPKDNPEANLESNSGPVPESEISLGEDAAKNLENKLNQEKIDRQTELEKKLDDMLPDLAELYAKNRRLIVGAKNRAEFTKLRGEYEKILDESLRLKAEATYENGKDEISAKLESRVEELRREVDEKLAEFAGDDPENPEKTPEEIEEERARLVEEANNILHSEYADMVKELETNVNAEFLNDFLEQQAKLEDATIDKLDNGTFCRKFVSKVINNKYLKGALIVAAAAGLAFTGVGLATGLAAGTMSVGLGYTAGGVALGASKGAFMGGLMSRQDSRNSAVRGFADEEEIRKQLEGIDVTNQDADTSNVAGWLMEQYSEANESDASSNKKRTAVAAGLGAAMGGLMSGVHVNNVTTKNVTERVQIGTEPTKYEPTMFDNVDIPQGHGTYDTFTQMGGNPDDLQKALDIMHSIDSKYGMVPGSNGETIGFNGQIGDFAHTYPGPINTWPDTAQSYITEVSEEWARQGLIPSVKTGGQPIYDTITKAVTDYVPNAFMNFMTRVTADVTAGAVGAVAGGLNERPNRVIAETPEPTPATPETSEAPTTEPEGIEPVSESEAPVSTPEISTSSELTQEEIDRMASEVVERLRQQQEEVPQSELDRMSAELEARLNQPEEISQEDIDRMSREIEDRLNQPEEVPQSELDRMAAELSERLNQPEEVTQEELDRMSAELEARLNQPASPEQDQAQNDFRDEITARFGNLIGEEGVDFMTGREGLNTEDNLRIANWWNSLSDEAKDAVVSYEANPENSEFGSALRAWLQTQELIPRG